MTCIIEVQITFIIDSDLAFDFQKGPIFEP